jgi:hypothetical protein
MLVKVQFSGNVMPDWFEVAFEHKDTVKSAGGKFNPQGVKPAHWELHSKVFKPLKEEIGAVKVTFKVTHQASGIDQIIFFQTAGETLFSVHLAKESDVETVRAFCLATQRALNAGKQTEAMALLQEIEAQGGEYFFKFVV